MASTLSSTEIIIFLRSVRLPSMVWAEITALPRLSRLDFLSQNLNLLDNIRVGLVQLAPSDASSQQHGPDVPRPHAEALQGHFRIELCCFFLCNAEGNLYCFVLFHNSLSSNNNGKNSFISGRRPKEGDFGAFPSAKRQDGPGTGPVFGRPVGQTPILQFGLRDQTDAWLSHCCKGTHNFQLRKYHKAKYCYNYQNALSLQRYKLTSL